MTYKQIKYEGYIKKPPGNVSHKDMRFCLISDNSYPGPFFAQHGVNEHWGDTLFGSAYK